MKRLAAFSIRYRAVPLLRFTGVEKMEITFNPNLDSVTGNA
jgi:hypothetical protein